MAIIPHGTFPTTLYNEPYNTMDKNGLTYFYTMGQVVYIHV